MPLRAGDMPPSGEPMRLPPVKITPGVPLTLPGVLPALGFRPNVPPPGSIRLPGPIPLTLPPPVVMPPASFGLPPPRLPMAQQMPPTMGGGDAATWDLMVDAFVRKTTSGGWLSNLIFES